MYTIEKQNNGVIITDLITFYKYVVNDKFFDKKLIFILNQELCNELFLVNDRYYRYFPNIYRTDEMTKHMIDKYGYIYYELYPYNYRLNYDLALSYVSHANTDIAYVPLEIIDKKINKNQ